MRYLEALYFLATSMIDTFQLFILLAIYCGCQQLNASVLAYWYIGSTRLDSSHTTRGFVCIGRYAKTPTICSQFFIVLTIIPSVDYKKKIQTLTHTHTHTQTNKQTNTHTHTHKQTSTHKGQDDSVTIVVVVVIVTTTSMVVKLFSSIDKDDVISHFVHVWNFIDGILWRY